MPAKVLPSAEDFNRFEERMLKEGFRRLTDVEFSSSFTRLGLQAQRQRLGRETGFVFSANGLTVYVWTTFLNQENCAREEDAGWVVITAGDKPVYYSHPMMRTEGFLRRMFRHAMVAKERVLNRPVCPSCRAYMQIARGRGLKARYWKCTGRSRPHYVQTFPWDYRLSEESITFLNDERRSRRRYRRSLEKFSIVVKPAMLLRRPWRIMQPQNRI